MMMAGAKKIYILMIRVNKLIFIFASQYFLKEIENMFFVFLLRYRNTSESLDDFPAAGVPTFLVSPNFYLCFYNSIETQSTYYISQIMHDLSFFISNNH